jgi:hypothetical protein
VVASFSAGVGRPTVVFQPMTGSGDEAAGENRVSTPIRADDDSVSRCRYLHEGIVSVVLVA